MPIGTVGLIQPRGFREGYNVGLYYCHYPFSLPAPTVLQRGEDLPGMSSPVLNSETGNPAEASSSSAQTLAVCAEFEAHHIQEAVSAWGLGLHLCGGLVLPLALGGSPTRVELE